MGRGLSRRDRPGGPRPGPPLGQLRGRRWTVCLGVEEVQAEVVAVGGCPPHVHVRLAVDEEHLMVTRDAGSASARLQVDLHVSELPADLRAALRAVPHGRLAAASGG